MGREKRRSLIIIKVMPIFLGFCAASKEPPVQERPKSSARNKQDALPSRDSGPDGHVDYSLDASVREPQGSRHPFTLPGEKHRIFWSTPQDKAPSRRKRPFTYWAGNEYRLFYFEPHLRGLGGGYLGVGSDQAYLFLGWQKPELAWLGDYDPRVAAVHRIHQLFIEIAGDPDAYIRLWSPRSTARARNLISRAFRDPASRRRHLKVHMYSHELVHGRLVRLEKIMSSTRTSCFLNEQKSFLFVRRLIRAQRVRPLILDLNGSVAVKAISRAARELEVPIRAVYLSNVDQYWSWYSPRFKSNMAALHLDKRSMVLRTNSWKKSKRLYTYHVYPARTYLSLIGTLLSYQARQILDSRTPPKNSFYYRKSTRDPF